MKILGIETSCDETAASIIEVKNKKVKVLSNIVSSQIDIHKKYGGVVPEIAAREHVLDILPVIYEALKKAKINTSITENQPENRSIDAIAVTIGPGLITSLIVGIETAKVLSYAWNIPLVSVNHIEGHIYSNFINTQEDIKFPALILTVSGGHTMLVLMKDHKKIKVIGETRDDAAGEAFDKAAKLMNIGYPGGPAISAEAEKSRVESRESNISLPRPMIKSNNLDFSFSGLKTALRYTLEKDKSWKTRISEYAHEFQQAVIDVLIYKTIKAAEKHSIKTIMLSGGVSANTELRKQLKDKVNSDLPNVNYLQSNLKYTTDNAAMIAMAGYYKAKNKKFITWQKIKVDCNLEL